MRPQPVVLALAVLLLAGCSSPGDGPTESTTTSQQPEPEVRHFSQVFPLQIGVDDEVVYSVDPGNCAVFNPEEREQMFRIVRGNATLTWTPLTPAPDHQELFLHVLAEQGAVNFRTPPSRSPISVTYDDINVTWSDQFVIVVDPANGTFQPYQEVTLAVDFTYSGDDIWARDSNCGFDDV